MNSISFEEFSKISTDCARRAEEITPYDGMFEAIEVCLGRINRQKKLGIEWMCELGDKLQEYFEERERSRDDNSGSP